MVVAIGGSSSEGQVRTPTRSCAVQPCTNMAGTSGVCGRREQSVHIDIDMSMYETHGIKY